MFERRTKGRVYYNTLNEQRKCHVTNIYVYTVEEKLKYHITFFCEKNKSIVLHYVLPNPLESVFLWPFSYSDRRIILSYCGKRKANYYVCKKNKRASILLYFQRTTEVSCYKYLHCRGKTKISYYITFFLFLVAFVLLKLKQQ